MGISEGAGFWESQAVAGALLTVPMVAIWMNEKLRVEPSFQRVGQDLYAELMAMNGPSIFKEELPKLKSCWKKVTKKLKSLWLRKKLKTQVLMKLNHLLILPKRIVNRT